VRREPDGQLEDDEGRSRRDGDERGPPLRAHESGLEVAAERLLALDRLE
jgi:hypothetical protein